MYLIPPAEHCFSLGPDDDDAGERHVDLLHRVLVAVVRIQCQSEFGPWSDRLFASELLLLRTQMLRTAVAVA